jgi:hypothetical protein
MGWIYAIIALVAIGAGSFGAWSYNDAIKGKQAAEAKAKYWEKKFLVEASVRKQREAEYSTSQKLAVAAKNHAKGLDDEKRDLEKRLRAALAAPGGIADVLGTVIPDDLRRMRREAAGCETDLRVPCTGELARGNISAADERRDGLPNHYGSYGTQKRTASSQP